MPLRKGDERYKQEHTRYAKKSYHAYMKTKRANGTHNRLRSYEDSRGMSDKEYAAHLEKVKKDQKNERSMKWLQYQEEEGTETAEKDNEKEEDEEGEGKMAKDEAGLKAQAWVQSQLER